MDCVQFASLPSEASHPEAKWEKREREHTQCSPVVLQWNLHPGELIFYLVYDSYLQEKSD